MNVCFGWVRTFCPLCAFWSPFLSRCCDFYKSRPGGHQAFRLCPISQILLKKTTTSWFWSVSTSPLSNGISLSCTVCSAQSLRVSFNSLSGFHNSLLFVQSVFLPLMWFPGRSLDEDSFRDVKQPVTVKQKQTFENRDL